MLVVFTIWGGQLMNRTKFLLVLAVCLLQGLDGWSTRLAIGHGIVESNGIVGNARAVAR